jgi:hypothetical protein
MALNNKHTHTHTECLFQDLRYTDDQYAYMGYMPCCPVTHRADTIVQAGRQQFYFYFSFKIKEPENRI